MSKKYSSDDYRRMMQEYENKMREARERELREMGNLFPRICGIDSPAEAEQFLATAMKNNSVYHWYQRGEQP